MIETCWIYRFWLPELLLAIAALTSFRSSRINWAWPASVVGAALLVSILLGTGQQQTNLLLIDSFALISRSVILSLLLLGLWSSRSSFATTDQDQISPYLLIAAIGLLMVSSANNLIVSLIGMELAVVPLLIWANRSDDGHTRHNLARLIISNGVASACLAVAVAIVYLLSGTAEFTIIKVNLATIQINAAGGMSFLLLPASLLMLTSLWMRAGWAPLHGSHQDWVDLLPSGLKSIVPVMIGIGCVVLFCRFFVNTMFAFHDPVMAPNDWGRTVGLLIASMGLIAVIQLFREATAGGYVRWSLQLQFAWLLLGALSFQPDGLAGMGLLLPTLAVSLALAVVAKIDEPVSLENRWQGGWRESKVQSAQIILVMSILVAAPLTPGFVAIASIASSALALAASDSFLWLWPVVLVMALATIAFWFFTAKLMLHLFSPYREMDQVPFLSQSITARSFIWLLTASSLLTSLYPMPLLTLLQAIPFGFGFVPTFPVR